MQLSALAASLNDSARSLSDSSEEETVFYENCAMRTQETNSNNAVRCLVMPSRNDSISVGVFYCFDNVSKVEESNNDTLNSQII